jgi:hypothetical protein
MEQVESQVVPAPPSPQQYPVGGGSPPPMTMQATPASSAASSQRVVLMVAAAAGMLGTFLPWVNIPIRGSVAGTEGDGWITLGLFAIALVVALSGVPGLGRRICMGLAGVAASAIGVHDAANVFALKAEMSAEGDRFSETLASSVSVGGGLYLVIIAGLVVALGALLRGSKQ